MSVTKNININIDSYPISIPISIVPNIVDIDIEIDISLTPADNSTVVLWYSGTVNYYRGTYYSGTDFRG